MSNARNLANLLGTDTKVQTADIADAAFQANKNLIINGAMTVAQRGTNFTGASGYTIDRFNFYNQSGSGVADVTQSTDVPAGSGFANSLKVDITTADTSNTAFEEVTCSQTIEAQDLQHLQYNTASAKELTLSFWVKSNKTGTYVVWFYVEDAGDQFSSSYTINSANTWEKKTISIPAKTSGGAPANDNGAGLAVAFILLAGDSYKSGTMPSNWETLVNANRYVDQTVNLFDSTSNDFYITGVQLEVGETATPFEHRSYGEELALCQRYYVNAMPDGTLAGYIWCTPIDLTQYYRRSNYDFPVTMRSVPTAVMSGIAAGGFRSGSPSTEAASRTSLTINGDVSTYNSGYSYLTSLTLDAEL